jgi:hypothetical protein
LIDGVAVDREYFGLEKTEPIRIMMNHAIRNGIILLFFCFVKTPVNQIRNTDIAATVSN